MTGWHCTFRTVMAAFKELSGLNSSFIRLSTKTKDQAKGTHILGTSMIYPVFMHHSVVSHQSFLVLVLLSAVVTPIHSCGTACDLKYRENCFDHVDFFHFQNECQVSNANFFK